MEKLGSLLSNPSQLREEPESQPFKANTDEWIEAVEKIFSQFSMHYGAARMAAHWSGLDAEKTKAYWARRLSGLSRRNLGYALQYLPDDPPSVDGFMAIARRCPPAPVRALTHQVSQDEWEHGRERIRQLAKQFGKAAS